MARKPRQWHAEDIKAALRKQGVTLSALCAEWDLHASAITNTLRRPLNSKRVERKIAAALGVPLNELWPDRWDDEGNSKPRSCNKHSHSAPSPKRQKRAAA